jgi:hypothetical protein|uniref:Uncharacterized protein n=1 Tax=viral metagenome TaxID=1070528 RepID=A0A6C0ANM6_9ZZZZ
MNEFEYNDIDSDLDKDRKKSKIELIQDFLYFESYNMVLLKEDMKRRFSIISPFFLDNLEIYHLSDFIIYLLFNKTEYTLKNYNINFLDLFTHKYNNELNISYNIISKYIEKFTNIKINFKTWVLFCITYSY